MPHILAPAHRVLRFAVVLTLAQVCAAHPGVVAAQGDVNAGTRLLVVVDDEDPASIIRTSGMARGAVRELQRELQRSGFHVITEESVASTPGWEVVKRPSRRKLIEAIQRLGSGDDASVRVDAGVLVRMYARVRQTSHGTSMSVIVEFKVYDATLGMFIDAFDVSPEVFPVRKDCATSAQCVRETVGGRVKEIAGSRAAVLARRIARYAPP